MWGDTLPRPGLPRVPGPALWAVAWQVCYMNTSVIFHLEILAALLALFENLGHTGGLPAISASLPHPRGGLAKEAEACCPAHLWSLHLHLPNSSSLEKHFQALVLAHITAYAGAEEQGLHSWVLC